MPLPALFAVVALLGGVERGEATFQPMADEINVPEQFRLDAATFPVEVELLRVTPNYRVSAVRFPSPIVTADPENNHGPRRVFSTQHARQTPPPWSSCISWGPISPFPVI